MLYNQSTARNMENIKSSVMVSARILTTNMITGVRTYLYRTQINVFRGFPRKQQLVDQDKGYRRTLVKLEINLGCIKRQNFLGRHVATTCSGTTLFLELVS
jgi:hypothetical protein